MIFGHPPPVPSPLRDNLVQRLAYLNNFLRVGLDDYFTVNAQSDRDMCKIHLQHYIGHVEGLVASLAQNPEGYTDQVLMDIPVCVVEQETSTAEWFTVVGPDEVNTAMGCISVLSPLGSALLLKRVNEVVELNAPGGRYLYRIGTIGHVRPEGY
ncbi:MAG TPA: GreA/GreB family elongation factor [Symbiobacteriaceae bacterium]|nr:GreA/GreB family elongation factor [Symbiobacteriaceae bacterium]